MTGSSWVGQRQPRLEDPIYLQGLGHYVDDIEASGLLHAVFVRSPVSHGRIVAIDSSKARAVSGVVDVIEARHLNARGLTSTLERPFFTATEMPILATDRVRFVGEPIAIVIAENSYLAEDAAELVAVDVEPLPHVGDLRTDMSPSVGPPLHDEAPKNLLIDVRLCDSPDVDETMANAHCVLQRTFRTARLTASPLEGRATLAVPDPGQGRITCWSSTQIPHITRSAIAQSLNIPERGIRVVAPDVGGGFGQKSVVCREDIAVCGAARYLGRPVRWVEDRRENLASAFQGHEQETKVRAAFDRDGKLLALDAEIEADVGAYSCFPQTCGVEPLMAANELPGLYDVSTYRVQARAVATNKPPMAPYRGVGRPQIVLAMERIMDEAAECLGIDRLELRQRNLIRSFPYVTATGVTVDEGSYSEALEVCRQAVDYDTWDNRQRRAAEEGRTIGLGVSAFHEPTGYGSRVFAKRGLGWVPGFESAVIDMDPTGQVTIAVGASGHGQGHRTTMAQVVAERVGVGPSDVHVLEGDTDLSPYGWGTFASRGAAVTGAACAQAADHLADKLRRIAAHLLEANADDVMLEGGLAQVADATEPSVPIRRLASIAHHRVHELPPGESAGLTCRGSADPPESTFSNAVHAAEVEVDRDTGLVRVTRFVVVEDCGVMLNPMVVEGQVRGGIAQGVSKALLESVAFDAQGQCQTATYLDYLVPTAFEIPDVEIHHLETPATTTVTGAKGMGEGGVIGAPAAVANAVANALRSLPDVAIEDVVEVCAMLPITPERVSRVTRRLQEHSA